MHPSLSAFPGRAALTLVVLAAASPTARADGYSLFDPRPRAQLRELSTDRPDTTESPISVDAGHVQIELDLVALGFAPGGASTLDLGAANLKVGLDGSTDLQVVLEPYHREASDTAMTTSGYGGTTVRIKRNLWGNDGGTTAAALLPFVALADDTWSAGLAVPIGFELPADFSAAVMPQLDLEDLGGDVGTSAMFTATASHDLFGPVGAYVESAFHASLTTDPKTAMQADGGLTLGVSDDVQLDLGTRLRVFGEVPDAEVFLGVAARR